MTIPIQPMSTAPRDGREVLLKIDPSVWGDVAINTVSAWWNERLNIWVARGDQYRDHYFSGWLDIEALALDSARLDWLDANGVARLDWCVERHRDKPIRAAIDKEAERD